MSSILSVGNFGEVYKGVWHETPVALKKLKEEDKREFEREAAMLL